MHGMKKEERKKEGGRSEMKDYVFKKFPMYCYLVSKDRLLVLRPPTLLHSPRLISMYWGVRGIPTRRYVFTLFVVYL